MNFQLYHTVYRLGAEGGVNESQPLASASKEPMSIREPAQAYDKRSASTRMTAILPTSTSPIDGNNAETILIAMAETLKAIYTSPTSTQVFSSNLPLLASKPAEQSVQEKTAYLSALRSQATQMQNDVNTFLTQKMEEEKAVESGAAKKTKAQEEKEEQMYGEEDLEDEG
ncbi:hypothetical protein B0A50_01095 [Salinomyces thailandicus]|uniref:EKC/KEOPS complex subunit GON7 n=1 Tax=Salinomyces thailandicus TaxID=706561 RepID=A0A4V6WJX8_9PEZI|nr:hypothetical protein B0A50_01095 [Salinomyces thailandica]